MGWAYPNLVGLGNGKACVFDQPETPGETRLYWDPVANMQRLLMETSMPSVPAVVGSSESR